MPRELRGREGKAAEWELFRRVADQAVVDGPDAGRCEDPVARASDSTETGRKEGQPTTRPGPPSSQDSSGRRYGGDGPEVGAEQRGGADQGPRDGVPPDRPAGHKPRANQQRQRKRRVARVELYGGLGTR